MKKRGTVQMLALVVIVGFLSFAGGYYTGGGKITAYATTKEILVKVEMETKESGVIEKTVTVRDGMTPLDALLKVTDVQTMYWEAYGTSVVRSIAGDNLGMNEGYTYTVNGEMPVIGINEYQLHDGDNLVISYTAW